MEKKFPDLKLLEKDKDGSRLSRELTSTIQRLYDFIDDLEKRLSTKIEEEAKLNVQRFSEASTLVNSFATSLAGLTNPPNPLATLGGGTVTSITLSAGSNLTGGGTVTSSGNISLAVDSNPSFTTVKISGTKVLDARRIGWTAWTGSATRTTFDTTTATLTNVAEAIKAIIDDLIAHGLIGT